MVVTSCAAVDMLVEGNNVVELVVRFEDDDDECRDEDVKVDDDDLAALLDAFSRSKLSCSSSSGVMA